MKIHKVWLIEVVIGLLAVAALLWTGMQRKAGPSGTGVPPAPLTATEPSLHEPVSEERPAASQTQPGERSADSSGRSGAVAREDSAVDSDPAVREFHRWAGRYAEETEPAAKRALVERGRLLARGHREAIKQLIPTDPQSALRQAFPMVLRQQLPPEVLGELEERINTRATFGVYAASSGDPEPIRRVVETPARRYKAYVYGRRLTQPTTPDDYLVGIAVDDWMALDERPLRVLEAREQPDPAKPLVRISPDDKGAWPASQVGDGRHEHTAPPFGGKAPLVEAGGTVYQLCGPGCLGPFERELLAFEGGTGGPVFPSYPVPGTSSTGVRSLLYLRLAFPDVLFEPQTEKAAYDMMCQVNAWFVESSYGSLYLLTTVAPLVVLPHTEAWYKNQGSEYDLRNDALAVAKALGYDGDAHDHVIFAYNGGPGNFNGLATVGGKHVWLKSLSVGTAAHELGHNFGLWHANFWNTSGLSVIGDGSNQEYGNVFDTMGPASAGNLHFSAAFKNQLGWLTKEFVHEVRRSGVYRIHAYDQSQLDPAKRYGFKVLKDTQRHYWGEFRQKFGASNPWLRDGVVLNWSPWSNSAGGTHLLDTTPGTSDGRTDAALTIGRTFSDFESGVHLTPVGKGGTSPESIDVVVNLGAFPGNQSPVAAVIVDQTSVGPGVTVNLTATASDADGDVLAYAWDFGDKTFSNTNSSGATKSWSTAGDYVVRCLVSDMKGGTASDSVIVRIGSPATFAITGEITSGGQPLANVRVHNGLTGTNYRGAYTDSDGTYTITGLSAGNVTLTAVLYGYSFTAGFANPVAVGPDFTGADFTATMLPQVTISTIDPIATEGGDTATIRLSRSGSTASALGVALAGILGPIAVEYTLSPDLNFVPSLHDYGFVIPAGQSSLDIVITALDDREIEGPEVLTIEIRSAASYVVTGVNSASVTLLDGDSPLPLVSVDASDAEATETGDGATFVVTRVGSTASALTVPFNLSGSAANGIDYAAIATHVIIPAGQSSAPVLITPIHDTVIEGVEDIIVTVAANAGYLISPTAGAASAFIVDDDIPTVSIVATDAVASEAGQDPATFVVTRTGNTSAPLTVRYALSGSAQHGVDYAVLPGSLTIPAGSSAGSITVVPINDDIGEPQQTIAVQIRGGTDYAVGSPASATANLVDNDLPVVTVGVSDATCAEPADAGQFKFTTAGTGSGNITVRYTVTGTATPGVDYTALAGTLSMGRNTTATVSVAVLDDLLPEDLETITVTIDPDPAYTVFLDKSATLRLLDNERNIVNVTPVGGSPGEGGGTSLAYYISRQGSTASALTVTYVMSGTATNGTDYQAPSGTVVIPAGQSGINVSATIIDDSLREGTETAILTLAPDTAYGLGIASATQFIIDGEVPSAQVRFASATGSGSESVGTVNIPVKLSATSATPVTVEYAIAGGSATGGIDYTLAAGMLTFDPGVTTLNIPLTIIDDLFDEPAQTVIIELKNAWNASLGTSKYTYTINDNDNPPPVTVGFAATASAAGENVSPALLSVTLSASQATPVTVHYAASGGTATGGGVDYALEPDTLTFAPGETVKPLPLTIIDDPLNEANETVIVTLDSPTGATLNANATHTYTIQNTPGILAVTAPTEIDITGVCGGPFNPAGATLTVGNTGDTPLNWTVSANAPWLALSATNGTLNPGASADVHVSVNAGAEALPPQTYNAEVAITNTTNHVGDTNREVTLAVLQPSVTAGFAAASSAAGENVSPAVLLVTLSASQPTPVTVHYAASGGTATGGGVDYTLEPGTLTFSPGETVQSIPITIIDDPLEEADETIIVTLDSPAGATLNANTTHTYTINNIAGILAVAQAAGFDSSGPGGGPFSPASVTYTLSNIADTPLDWTAGANAPWIGLTATSGTLNPGASVEVLVSLNAGAEALPPQLHTATLSFTNTTNHNGDTNRDVNLTVMPPPVTVGFAVASSAAGENVTPAVPLVTLSASQPTPVTVHYAATGGTATGGGVDYTLEPGTLTFAPGETVQSIPITIIDDSLNEADETIIVTLDSPAGATLNANTTHTHTINNIAGILAVTPAAGFDSSGIGGGPFSPASATYTLTNIADTPLDWTAGANAAWVALSAAAGTLNPGASVEVVVSLNAGAEALPPQLHTATLSFTNTTNHNGDTSRDVNLTVIPPPVTVGFAAASSAAGENVSPAVLLVTLSASQPTPVTVHYAATGGTATGGGVDYALEPGTLTFSPGETVQSIPITIIDDSLNEADETIIVTLDSPAGATLNANTTHTHTILNIAGILAVTPVAGFDSTGFSGGPFSPASATYTLTNIADTPIDWTAGTNATWVALSAAGGTLNPGASVDVIVSLNAGAEALPPQLHTATVTFTNTTNHNGDTTRDVNLTVIPPPVPSQITLTGEGAVLRFWGIPGTDYHIERSIDLETWTPIGLRTAPANGIIEFTDTSPPAGKAFYRTATP